jgi:glycosyltransferase involved in cell wall biosynthesis
MEYSVIIPAFNEEELLPATLDALREAMKEINRPGQVIVVDNNSSDATAEIAKAHGALVVFEPKNQISRARNAGAAAATGSFLVFVDADSLVSAGLLESALSQLDGGRCCGGGSTVKFDETNDKAEKILKFWTHASIRFSLAAGSFMFCLREGFDAVGGFSESVYAGEEIWFGRSLKRWGTDRNMVFTILTATPLVTSLRKFHWYPPWRLRLQVLILVLFPWATRFPALCRYWYRRPKNFAAK